MILLFIKRCFHFYKTD